MFRIVAKNGRAKVVRLDGEPVQEGAYLVALLPNHAGMISWQLEVGEISLSVFRKYARNKDTGFAHIFVNGRGIAPEHVLDGKRPVNKSKLSLVH